MKVFEINSNLDYATKITCEDYSDQSDESVMINVGANIEHRHEIRLFTGKMVLVNNHNKKKLTYNIPMYNFSYKKGQYSGNYTEFIFGGSSGSIYIFSNLIIKGVFKTRYNPYESELSSNTDMDLPNTKEAKFMQYSMSTVIFHNCIFKNDSDIEFRIEATYQATVKFVRCDFEGKFKFVELDEESSITY